MKIEDFDKSKKELKNEIKKNNEKLAINDERKRMANVNQFEYKATETMAFSLLPYLGCLMLLLNGVTKSEVLLSFVKAVPVGSLPCIIIGGSLCLGTIGRKILESKYKTKERLNRFTTAHTQSEKIQEEVKYTIELEKANNRNEAIMQTINSLNSKKTILKSLSSNYKIEEKNLPETEEESNTIIDNYATLLKNKYAELDLITAQKGDIPLLMLKDYLVSLDYLSIFAPFIVGTVVVSGYMIKRSNDYLKAFNNLNNQLGDVSLPIYINDAFEEQQGIDFKIERKISEISKIELKLQEQKRIMESFLEDNVDEATVMPREKEHVTEEIFKNNMSEYNQENFLLFRGDESFIEGENESHLEAKGPSLILKKKIDNRVFPQEK